MSEFTSAKPLSPDDALPPVEPPNAGFILQLFVIPGVIVAIIVVVWLLFNWLAQMGNNPQSYIDALEKNNDARWHAAMNLANALGDPHYDGLKDDPTAVRRLASILDREVDAGKLSDEDLRLRQFICEALGFFRLPEAAPSLIKAATTRRNDAEAQVQIAAIHGLTNLAANLQKSQPKAAALPEIVATLERLSRDSDDLIRSQAAFGLGAVGGEEAQPRLRQMLHDQYVDARYNAATGLARSGDPAALDTLLEMLDPKQTVGVAVEKGEQSDAQVNKRANIYLAGLEATRQFAGHNRQADLEPLFAAVKTLQTQKLQPEVASSARETLELLQNSRAEAAPSH